MCQLFKIISRRKLQENNLFLVVPDKNPDLSPKFQPLSAAVMFLHKVSFKSNLPAFFTTFKMRIDMGMTDPHPQFCAELTPLVWGNS